MSATAIITSSSNASVQLLLLLTYSQHLHRPQVCPTSMPVNTRSSAKKPLVAAEPSSESSERSLSLDRSLRGTRGRNRSTGRLKNSSKGAVKFYSLKLSTYSHNILLANTTRRANVSTQKRRKRAQSTIDDKPKSRSHPIFPKCASFANLPADLIFEVSWRRRRTLYTVT